MLLNQTTNIEYDYHSLDNRPEAGRLILKIIIKIVSGRNCDHDY